MPVHHNKKAPQTKKAFTGRKRSSRSASSNAATGTVTGDRGRGRFEINGGRAYELGGSLRPSNVHVGSRVTVRKNRIVAIVPASKSKSSNNLFAW